MSVYVSGLFSLNMEVLDSGGTVVTRIDDKTSELRHVIHAENISSLPRGARVKASLPNGTRRLEFAREGNTSASWEDEILNIASGGTGDLECAIRRNDGPAGSKEPLQCDELHEKRGMLAWRQLSAGDLPFQIAVDVG